MRAWITDGYPGGSRQVFSNPTNLAWKQQPCKLVLHTVEGGGYPSATTYRNGQSAPHATVDPWNRTWRQHYPLTEAAWALRATSLVSTNTMGAVQVEIIGTCDPRNTALAGKFVPGISGAALEYLVGFLRYLAREAGIPWRASLAWAPYPASYGTGAAQRLSAAAWTAYRGLIGHQHVPGNTHGDPGAIPIARWLALGNPPIPTPTPEDDMPTAAEIAEAVWSHPVTIALPDGSEMTEPAGVWLAWGNRASWAAVAAAGQATGADPAAIEAAVARAVRSAISGATIVAKEA